MNLYAVFYDLPQRPRQWVLTTNKREAAGAARRKNGLALMMRGPKDRWRGSWDGPTFRALADEVVADYR